MTTYGVLGVGSIAEAIVTGLCSVDMPPEVVLSPRNSQRSGRLAARFATVRVAGDNQSVVDAAEVVVVCLLPEHADDVLGGLAFRPGHRVVSAVAGLSTERLGRLVAPATDVARSVPLPAVATRSSTTPVHPPTDAAEELYGRLGGTLPVADERAYDSLSAASAAVAAHLDYLGTIADWVVGHGIEPARARKYVADLFADLAPELRSPDVDFAALAAAHSTPGGLNEQLARHLRDAGHLDDVRSGLDDLLDRVVRDGD